MNIVKKRYKVSGMHCVSCAMLIEGEIEDLGAKAKCNYTSQDLVVEFDPDKINEQLIKNTVEKAGYKIATNVL